MYSICTFDDTKLCHTSSWRHGVKFIHSDCRAVCQIERKNLDWRTTHGRSSLCQPPSHSKRVSGLSPHQFRWHQFEVYAIWQFLSAKNKERIKKLFSKNNINDCRSRGSSWEWGDSVVVLRVVMVPECINRNIIKMPSGLAIRFFHIIATAGKLLA